MAKTEEMEANFNISAWGIIFCVASPFLYIGDVGSDIYTAYKFLRDEMMVEFGWTLAFILMPGVVNTVLYYMQKKDSSPAPKPKQEQEPEPYKWQILQLLLLQAMPLWHSTKALIHTWKWWRASRQGDYFAKLSNLLLKDHEDKKAVPHRMIECFLEAAPQLALQITIVLRQTDKIHVFQIVTICTSAVGMLPTVCAIVRDFHVQRRFTPLTLLLALGHYLIILSRLITISIIACLHPLWTVFACSLHIIVMTPLFNYQRMLVNSPAKVVYAALYGVIFLFTYIIPNLSYPKLSNVLYYTICLIQNIICNAFWYVYASDYMRLSYSYYPVVISMAPYFVGVGLVAVFYVDAYRKGQNIMRRRVYSDYADSDDIVRRIDRMRVLFQSPRSAKDL